MTVQHNADAVARQIVATSVQGAARVVTVTQHYGVLMTSGVQAAASGRPGPRAQTGDYRRSITTQMSITPTSIETRTETNKPQAYRLEHGFIGVDALGREYDQPALPHFGPTHDRLAPQWEAGLVAAVAG